MVSVDDFPLTPSPLMAAGDPTSLFAMVVSSGRWADNLDDDVVVRSVDGILLGGMKAGRRRSLFLADVLHRGTEVLVVNDEHVVAKNANANDDNNAAGVMAAVRPFGALLIWCFS